jgi:ribonuclease HI
VVTNDLCQFCWQEKETIVHALWECPASQDVWGASERAIQKCRTVGSDFMGLIGELVEKLGREDLFLFAVTTREIWRRRNVVLHGGVFSHPSMVTKCTAEALRQFKQVTIQDPNQEEDEPVEIGDGVGCIWQAPPQGTYKANWDIAVSSGNRFMGVGVVIRDGNGLVSATKSTTVSEIFEPAAGEALAARQATEFCRDLGLFDIILEGDSLMVTRALEGKDENWLRFGQIVEDTKLVLRSFRHWRISHVRREANGAAHGLANEAIRTVMDKVWMEETPDCISSIVSLELLALAL